VALCKEAFAEAEIDDTDTEPGREACGGAHVGEPREDHSGASVYGHVGKEGEGGACSYCDIGEPGARGTEENFGGVARGGEAICTQVALDAGT